MCKNQDNPDIALEFKIISNLICRNIDYLVQTEEGGQITGLQMRIIHYLKEAPQEDIFQKDIEKHFSIRRSTVTTVLHTMERNGLLTKVSVPGDARLKKLTLTQAGLFAEERMHDRIDRFNEHFLSGISPEELNELNTIFQKLKQNLHQEETL